jgi:hypothetical protein
VSETPDEEKLVRPETGRRTHTDLELALGINRGNDEKRSLCGSSDSAFSGAEYRQEAHTKVVD